MKPKHRACQFIQIIVKYASLKFAFFKYAVPLVLLLLSFSTQAAGLRIVNPAADSKVKNAVVVTVKLPVSTNATAAKVNMIIDRQFFKSQPYIKGKVYYKFTIPTNRYTNGAHWVNVRSVVNGKIVAADTKRLLFANQVLAVHTPTANRTLSGIINVTGITRARASKINIKFGDINDNSVVFSHALPSSHVKAKPFAVQVDTRKIGINGPINMHVRAIRDGRNLRTVTRQVNLQNTLSITTAIPVPSSRAYFGIYTLNNLNQTAATAKQSATDAFEALVYENGNARVSMDRVFFQWDNLLKARYYKLKN